MPLHDEVGGPQAVDCAGLPLTAAAAKNDHEQRTSQHPSRCSRGLRVLLKSPPRCFETDRDLTCATFLHCVSLRPIRCARLTTFFLPRCTQACDPTDRAVWLRSFIGYLTNVSKWPMHFGIFHARPPLSSACCPAAAGAA